MGTRWRPRVPRKESSGDLVRGLRLRGLRLLRSTPGDVDVVVHVVSDLASKSVDSPQPRVGDRRLGLPASFLALLEDARRADGAGLEHPVVPPHDVDPRRAAHDLCVFLVEKDNLNKCPFLAVRSLNLPTFLWSDTAFLECGTENRQFLNNLKIKGSTGNAFKNDHFSTCFGWF